MNNNTKLSILAIVAATTLVIAMAGASYAPSAHALSFSSTTNQQFSGTQTGLANIGNLGATVQACVICVDSSSGG